MLAEVDLASDHIAVKAPARLRDEIAKVPGARYKAATQTWRLPRHFNALAQLYGVLGPDHIRMSTDVANFLAQEKAHEARRASLRALAVTPELWTDDTTGPAELYPFQRAGLGYLTYADESVLGDDPGMGKTPTATLWARAGNGPALVVTPKQVQTQALDALNRWWPERQHRMVSGSALKRRKAIAEYAAIPEDERGGLVVSFSQIPLHSRITSYGSIRLTEEEKTPKELNELTFTSLLVDEAHRAFNPKTKWTRGLWWIRGSVSRCLVMTGTPVENSPLDFWALLHLADPDGWPGRSKVQDLYMHTSLSFWGGVESINLRADTRPEWDRLVNRIFVRRTKAQALPWLPKVLHVTREVELPPKLRKQYEALKKELELARKDAGPRLVAADAGEEYCRLVQAASATIEYDGWENKTLANGLVVPKPVIRMSMPSPKIDGALEAMEDYGLRQPFLITSRDRQLLDLMDMALLEKFDIKATKIVGGMSAQEIADARDAFNDGTTDVCLLSVGAGAEGLNLTRGSIQIRLTLSPRQLENKQAIDRQHGIGRGDHESDHLLVVTLRSVDTVEEGRMARLDEKDLTFKDLFG